VHLRRTPILVVVIVAHGLLALLLARAFGLRMAVAPREPVLTWIQLPAAAPATRHARTAGLPLPPQGPAPPATLPATRDPDAAGAITVRSTDWAGEAHHAAQDLAQSAGAPGRGAGDERKPERSLPWTEPKHNLLPKNGVLDLSLDRHGIDLTFFDRCVIHDIIAFGCRLGPKQAARGDLFEGMQGQLDRRTSAPLP
jgi:hypothetical protein